MNNPKLLWDTNAGLAHTVHLDIAKAKISIAFDDAPHTVVMKIDSPIKKGERITDVHVALFGHPPDESRVFRLSHDVRPWSTVEEIAAFVAGDGTDAQRVALADAIRTGWAVGAQAHLGGER